MKITKKIVSLILVFLMITTAFPLSVFAENTSSVIDSGYCGANGDNLTWTLYNDGELVIDGEGGMRDYHPHGLWPSYSPLPDAKNVVIKDGVTTIGCSAFEGHSEMKTIEIPNSVTSIGTLAFYGCTNIKDIVVPNSVTNIGDFAFESCVNLTNIQLSNNITTLKHRTFYSCDSLSTIEIPESVTIIEDSVFSDCDNLESIVISNNVISIGSSTFHNCDNLSNVVIQNGVKNIDNEVFNSCDNLTRVVLPNSIENVSYCLFTSCQNLNEVIINHGPDKIESGAFQKCKNLEKVSIPISVISIDKYAFYDCDSLSDVYYGGSQEDWEKISIDSGNSCLTNATIHFSDGSKITANKVSSSGNNIVISPDVVSVKDEIDDDDLGVKCTIGSVITENDKENRDFIISSKNVAEKVTLSKAEFQNYIIPADVIESWQHIELEETQDNIPSYKHTAMLRKDYKDGKPYVSTVFVRKGVNEYVNVIQSDVKVFKNKKYDIIISADNLKGSGYTYYIEQDAKHKISNSTGVFTDEDLYSVLDFQKECYAYVKSADGVISELEKINLSKQPADSFDEDMDFLKGSTFNLLGNDFFKFTIPSDVPLVGDATISLEAFSLPAGFEYQDNTLKISIGANIFNYGTEIKKNSETKYKKWSAECFKDWKNLCDETPYSADKKKRDEYKKAKEKFEDTWYGKKGKAVKTKDFDIDALGYIEASIVNGEIVIKEASLSISGSYTFKYTQQGAIWVIPAYIYAEAGGSLGGAATGSRVVPDSELPFKWEWTITFEPSLKVGAGAGVKDVAAAGVWAKATMPLVLNLTKENFKWDLTGEIGIEAEFFILKAEKTVFDGTLNLVDWYFGDNKSIKDKKYMSAKVPQVTTSIIDRDYLENTSPWLGGVSTWGLRSVVQNGLSLTQLQTSVLGQASPQVVAFGDKMLMTWVEDAASRDTYNRMRLMYSIYKNGVWSEPVAVADDGRNDTTPVIATDGTDVYFAWQKIEYIITEKTATIEHLVENTEIFTAKYDASAGKIVDVRNVSDNSCYDYAQSISIVNGKAVCYWASCKDNAMNISTDNSIYRYEAGSEKAEVKTGLNYILALAGASVKGSEHISYSMDADSDTTTTDDITVYTLADGKVTAFDKGENNVAYTSLFYGELDGKQTLFTSDMRNIYYIRDGETKSVIENMSALDGNFNYVVKNGVPTLFWTENRETGNAVFSSSYEDDVWTNPVQVSDTETQLSSVDIVVYNDEFRGVCTSGVIEYDEEKQTNKCVQTDLCSLKIDEVQDISVDGIYINEEDIRISEATEFSVYVTNNGTKAVKNISFEISDTLGYCANVEKEVNLASGEGTFVDLTYTAPENYSKTTLSVTATCNEINDSNYENDTSEKEIGIAKLVITESEVIEIDGQYKFTAMVTNESDVVAENVKIFTSFNDSEEVAKSIEIEAIGARETYSIQYIVSLEEIVFDDETDVSRLYISVDETDEKVRGNRICYIIERPEGLECGHIMTQVTGDYEPTCTTAGSTGVVQCTLCGEIITEVTEIPVTDHIPEVIPGKPATETETGLTDGEKCSVCDKILVAQTEIPMLVHAHDYVTVVTPPTCIENGYTTYTCTCGDTYTADEVSATGHIPEVILGKPATETETGLTDGEKCSVCDKILVVQTEIPILVHVHDYVTVVTAPTCAANGYTTYICACGDSYVDNSVDATGNHSDADKNYKCDVCDAELEKPPVTGEKYILGDVNNDGEITASDARMVLRASAELDELSDEQLVAADIDSNGEITASDARIVLRISAELESIDDYIKEEPSADERIDLSVYFGVHVDAFIAACPDFVFDEDGHAAYDGVAVDITADGYICDMLDMGSTKYSIFGINTEDSYDISRAKLEENGFVFEESDLAYNSKKDIGLMLISFDGVHCYVNIYSW